MKVSVTKDKVSIIEKDIVHAGEYNVNHIEFEFSAEYTVDLVKNAVFSIKDNVYQTSIINDQCDIPAEILSDFGEVVFGVYAYEVNDDQLDLRYSPFPARFTIISGSYDPTAEESEEITPSQFEQYMQALNDGLNQVKDSISELNQATESANELVDEINEKLENGDFIGPQGPQGPQGVPGNDGVGISTITSGTPVVGEEKTVTPVTFGKTDGTSETVNVEAQNGETQDLSGYATNDVLDDIVPKNTASGEMITVDDALAYKTFNVTVDGSSEQVTTKGNQLIDFANPNQKSSTLSSSFENDVLNISSTSGGSYQSATWNITNIVKSNTGKTLKYKDKTHSVTNENTQSVVQLIIRYNDDTPTFYLVLGNYITNGLNSFQIPNDVANIREAVFGIYTNNTADTNITNSITVEEPLLYFDNNDVYEPYTGGQPSPSPDYPQEITTLTFDKITRCGKNLATENFANQNSSINLARTLKKGEKITIVVNMTATDNPPSEYGINIYDQDNEQVWGNSYANWQNSYDGWNSFVVTVKNDTSRLRINSYGYEEIEIPTAVLSGALVVENKYVNNGSLYEPYQGQTYSIDLQGNEMVELPNGIKDELVIDKYGNVNLIKNVGKKIFNGTEDGWWLNESNQFRIQLPGAISWGKLLSNRFIEGADYEPGEMLTYVNNYILFISDKLNVEDWKAWLQSNNVVVYYELIEPQTINLGKLEDLISTDEGSNTFAINGNIDTQISVIYALDIKKYIDNKLAEISTAMIEEG